MHRPSNVVRGGIGVSAGTMAAGGGGRLPGPVGVGLVAERNSRGDRPLASWARTYRFYKYAVHVGGDGAILVQDGDWLSKYSCAIHGNPWQVHEYGRRDATGRIVPVVNVDIIIARETLFHMPSVPRYEFRFVTGISREPTEEEKRRALLAHLRLAEGVSPEHLAGFKSVLDTISLVDNVANLVSVADDLAAVTRVTGVAGQVGTVLGAAGPFLMFAGFALDIVNAVTAGRRGYANQAVIETTVAWAFDLPKPAPARYVLDNLTQMRPQDIPLWKRAWNESQEAILRELEREAIRRVKPHIVTEETKAFDPVASLKLTFRVLSKNDPSRLRGMLREKIDIYGGGPMSQAAKKFGL